MGWPQSSTVPGTLESLPASCAHVDPFDGPVFIQRSTGQGCRLEEVQRDPSLKGNQVNKGNLRLGDGYLRENTELIQCV